MLLLSTQPLQPPLVGFETRNYFNPRLVDRVNQLLRYSNPATACYALHELPKSELRWVPSTRGAGDKSDLLHLGNKPVAIWIVGEAVVPKFVQGEFYPKKPSLLIRPLLQEDTDTANYIIRNYSQPILCASRHVLF